MMQFPDTVGPLYAYDPAKEAFLLGTSPSMLKCNYERSATRKDAET